MPTIEERLQALEREHAQLKKTIELQTIAIRALVSKEAFEKLQDAAEKIQETVEKSQEQNNKLFDVLNTHNIFTNQRLGDIQNQLIEQDGKIVGLQTEMRQRFNEQDSKFTQRFNEQDNKIAGLDNKVTGLQTTQTEHTALLQQILARLPKQEP